MSYNRTLTDSITEYVEINECSDSYKNYVKQYFEPNISDYFIAAVFGRSVTTFSQIKQCDKSKLKEALTENELSLIKRVEDNAIYMIDNKKMEPIEAVKESIYQQKRQR